MRLQIALEYMIVFAFVMLLFMVIFVTVAKQRASLSSQQLDSHIQLVAGDLASQINLAQQAGNGYNATVLIPSSGSLLAYSLNITGNGEIITSSRVGNQLVSSVDFSLATDVASNPSWLASNADSYSIPVTNGTVSITNNYGTICVDYACPNITSQAGTVSLASLSAYAPQFNGKTSYISTGATDLPVGNAARSIFAWIYYAGTTGNEYDIYSYGAASTGERFQLTVTSNVLNLGIVGSGVNSRFAIPKDQWSFVGVSYSTNTVTFFYNGQSQTLDLSGVDTAFIGTPSSTIGAASGTDTPTFQGSIADVQVYNTTFSALAANALYAEGIDGQPVAQPNLVAWWPLNGNTNDYSGNKNNGNANGYLPYSTVVRLFAKVINRAGTPMADSLIGFQSSLGNFSTGTDSYSNYTNSSGIATAILTQQQSNGYAVVKATAFGGSPSTQDSLVSWWPLNLGQGTSAPEISGSNNIGTMNAVSWDLPAFATGFDGYQSYAVGTGNTVAAQPETVTAWIYSTEPNALLVQNVRNEIFDASSHSSSGFETTYLNTQGNRACFLYSPATSNYICSINPIAEGTWYFVAGTYNASGASAVENVYINGALANSTTVSKTLGTAGAINISIGMCSQCSLPYYFDGRISNVQEYSNSFSPGAIAMLYGEGIGGTPLPNQGLMGWWPLDGNANDYSGNSQNASLVNTYSAPFNLTALTNSSTGAMYVAKFTPSGSPVMLGNSINLQPLGSVSITAWITANSIQYGRPQIVSNNGTSGQQGYNFSINNGKLEFIVRQLGYGWTSCETTSTSDITDGRTHFVSGVYNGSGISVYIDGTLQAASQCHSGPINYSVGSVGLIGSSYNGTISNLQIYSSALSAANISSLYLNGPDAFPQSAAGLAGWYPLDGNTNDFSIYGDNGTSNSISYGIMNATDEYGTQSFGGYGVQFNGKSSYIASDANALPSGSSPRSIFAWIYYAGTTGNEYDIYSYGAASTGERFQFTVTSNVLNLGIVGSGVNSRFAIPKDQWSFVGVSYSTNTVTFFYNGQSQAVSFNGINTVLSASPASTIGAISGSLTPNFQGSIADVQVYSTALNASEAFQLYKNGLPPYATAYIPMTWLP